MSNDTNNIDNNPDGSIPEGQDGPQNFQFKSLLDIFEKIDFKEYWRRVSEGLKAPPDTGEYKWAKFQILRLWAPISAVVVPIIVLIILVVMKFSQPEPRAIPIMTVEAEEVTELDKPEPIKEEPVDIPEPQEDVVDDNPGFADTPNDSVGADAPFSPVPTEIDAVAIVKSPITFKGIYGSRTPGMRGSTLGQGGGGAGTEAAVLRALRWLKKNQDYDGSWAPGAGGGPVGKVDANSKAAMTGLALLTYLAHGETPASEEFGQTVEKAMQWLVSAQDASGHFAPRDEHDYTHPICAYALCEAFAMTKVPMLKQSAEKAIDAILTGQQSNGGFNYNLNQDARHDTSYMAWCVQALKAASGAGLYQNDKVKEAMKKAIGGIKGNAGPGGGFGYIGPGNTYLTGAGVLAMQLLGAGNDPAARGGLQVMQGYTCSWQAPTGQNPIYFWYYITQAKFHGGGEAWNGWNKQFSPALVKNQIIIRKAIEGIDGKMKDIGYWAAAGGGEFSKNYVYNTTLCALMLQVYYRYLPTYKTPAAEGAEEIKIEDQKGKEIEIDIM